MSGVLILAAGTDVGNRVLGRGIGVDVAARPLAIVSTRNRLNLNLLSADRIHASKLLHRNEVDARLVMAAMTSKSASR